MKRIWSKTEVRYVVVGIWNTIFAFAVFALIATSFEESWSLVVILTVSSAIGISQSYVTQKKFVWISKNKVSHEFTKFVVVSISQFFANLVLLQIMTVRFGFAVLPSQLLITAILIAITFVGLKLWVFRTKAETPQSNISSDAS
jgi:putative flippase GtrA